MEELRPEWFRVEIPLPGSPLKSLNSYIIRGEKRNLIVDTGLNREECFRAMMSALDELRIDRSKTDFFITHLHADHFGLLGRLVTPSSRTMFNRPDAEIIESWSGWEPMLEYAARSGFPREDLMNSLGNHPGYKYSSAWVPELSLLKEGDVIECGRYSFLCLETPGHTPGHICLYEPREKILIAGDHLLGDITPNIQCWSDTANPLKHYLESLDKIEVMDIALVLPGHRNLFDRFRHRIAELKEHHRVRLEEALNILNEKPQSAYQVASSMTWDIVCDSWRDFPPAQKWFALGEAISHLRYLEEAGSIRRENGNDIIYQRR